MTNPILGPATCDEYLATLPWVDATPMQRELIEASIRRMWGMLERREREACAAIALAHRNRTAALSMGCSREQAIDYQAQENAAEAIEDAIRARGEVKP